MTKKKRKNNASNRSLEAQAFEMLRPLVDVFESIEIPLEVDSPNLRYIKQRASNIEFQKWRSKGFQNHARRELLGFLKSLRPVFQMTEKYGDAVIEEMCFHLPLKTHGYRIDLRSLSVKVKDLSEMKDLMTQLSENGDTKTDKQLLKDLTLSTQKLRQDLND